MRTLSDREKRTIRVAAWGVGIYLVLFVAFVVWQKLEKQRSDYRGLSKQANEMRQVLKVYETRAAVAQKLMNDFHMDPAKLSRVSVVADASAAIQKAAKNGGLQVGTIRESPARASAKELATVQFEGTGPVPAVLSLLGRLESLGYPLVVDSVLFTPESSRPGHVKVNLTIVILDFDQWKTEAVHHA